MQKFIITAVLKKNANFFRWKLAKIWENCDHNIDPWSRLHFDVDNLNFGHFWLRQNNAAAPCRVRYDGREEGTRRQTKPISAWRQQDGRNFAAMVNARPLLAIWICIEIRFGKKEKAALLQCSHFQSRAGSGLIFLGSGWALASYLWLRFSWAWEIH
jgi:hypothetical protein